jgi:hypothetical protein
MIKIHPETRYKLRKSKATLAQKSFVSSRFLNNPNALKMIPLFHTL